MLLNSAIAAVALIAHGASAQLILPQLQPAASAQRDKSAFTSNYQSVGSSKHQVPLGSVKGNGVYLDQMPYKAGQFTRRKQTNQTCATAGEEHWTGTIDVTDTHRLFYWVFESRNDPANDPVLLWMNGGPGGSSLMGGFNEMGACWLRNDSNSTEPNPWGWNNRATVIILDQPAGVGFSTVAEGGKGSNRDAEGAEDFQTFLNLFFDKAFPEKKNLPIILAGESYGGHYIPTYVNHILNARSYDSSTAFRGNITGMVLVDALLEFQPLVAGTYDLLCESETGKGILTHEECKDMQRLVPANEALGDYCTVTQNSHDCAVAFEHGMDIWAPYQKRVDKGHGTPYNIHLRCKNPEQCGRPDTGFISIYFNKPDVKEALGYSPAFEYKDTNIDLNTRYAERFEMMRPTTKMVASILDAVHTEPMVPQPALRNGLADIKLLIFNGNDDWIVNTAGNKRIYDNLRWSKQAEYRAAKFRSLEGVPETTGEWKATRDGRLVFMALDEAGHLVPGDLRPGTLDILEKWIDGEWHF